MKRLAYLGGIITVAALLAGCPKKETVYYNPDIDARDHAKQFKIDKALCLAQSHGAAPSQQVVINPTTAANSSGYQTNTGNSFATGFANGMNLGASINASRVRNEIFEGCMLSHGWTTDPEEHRKQKSETVQEAIDATPKLAYWQKYDEVKWSRAVEIDNELRDSPAYDGVRMSLRFKDVVKIVESEFR